MNQNSQNGGNMNSTIQQNNAVNNALINPGESQIVGIQDNNQILLPLGPNQNQNQYQNLFNFPQPVYLIRNEYRQIRHTVQNNIFYDFNGQHQQRIQQLEGWANVENNLVKRLEEKVELLAKWGQERENENLQLIEVVKHLVQKMSELENNFSVFTKNDFEYKMQQLQDWSILREREISKLQDLNNQLSMRVLELEGQLQAVTRCHEKSLDVVDNNVFQQEKVLDEMQARIEKTENEIKGIKNQGPQPSTDHAQLAQLIQQKVESCISLNQVRQVQKNKNNKLSVEQLKLRKEKLQKLYEGFDKEIVDTLNSKYLFHKIKADGNCFYRAINKCMGKDEDLYKNLKQSSAKWMIDNRLYYHAQLQGIDIQELIQSISQDGKFAGDAEIRGVSDSLGMCIILHFDHPRNSERKPSVYNQAYKVNGILEILFTPGMDENNNILIEKGHYSAITRMLKKQKQQLYQDNSKNNNIKNKNSQDQQRGPYRNDGKYNEQSKGNNQNFFRKKKQHKQQDYKSRSQYNNRSRSRSQSQNRQYYQKNRQGTKQDDRDRRQFDRSNSRSQYQVKFNHNEKQNQRNFNDGDQQNHNGNHKNSSRNGHWNGQMNEKNNQQYGNDFVQRNKHNRQ